MPLIRVYHPWWGWECYKAGFFNTGAEGLTSDAAREMYAEFLSDLERFNEAMHRVSREWPVSCEHFLTNESINRVAWLGQASMCIETGVPSRFKSGFRLLCRDGQYRANKCAERFLSNWIITQIERQSGLKNTLGSGAVRATVPTSQMRFQLC